MAASAPFLGQMTDEERRRQLAAFNQRTGGGQAAPAQQQAQRTSSRPVLDFVTGTRGVNPADMTRWQRLMRAGVAGVFGPATTALQAGQAAARGAAAGSRKLGGALAATPTAPTLVGDEDRVAQQDARNRANEVAQARAAAQIDRDANLDIGVTPQAATGRVDLRPESAGPDVFEPSAQAAADAFQQRTAPTSTAIASTFGAENQPRTIGDQLAGTQANRERNQAALEAFQARRAQELSEQQHRDVFSEMVNPSSGITPLTTTQAQQDFLQRARERDPSITLRGPFQTDAQRASGDRFRDRKAARGGRGSGREREIGLKADIQEQRDLRSQQFQSEQAEIEHQRKADEAARSGDAATAAKEKQAAADEKRGRERAAAENDVKLWGGILADAREGRNPTAIAQALKGFNLAQKILREGRQPSPDAPPPAGGAGTPPPPAGGAGTQPPPAVAGGVTPLSPELVAKFGPDANGNGIADIHDATVAKIRRLQNDQSPLVQQMVLAAKAELEEFYGPEAVAAAIKAKG